MARIAGNTRQPSVRCQPRRATRQGADTGPAGKCINQGGEVNERKKEASATNLLGGLVDDVAKAVVQVDILLRVLEGPMEHSQEGRKGSFVPGVRTRAGPQGNTSHIITRPSEFRIFN